MLALRDSLKNSSIYENQYNYMFNEVSLRDDGKETSLELTNDFPTFFLPSSTRSFVLQSFRAQPLYPTSPRLPLTDIQA